MSGGPALYPYSWWIWLPCCKNRPERLFKSKRWLIFRNGCDYKRYGPLLCGVGGPGCHVCKIVVSDGLGIPNGGLSPATASCGTDTLACKNGTSRCQERRIELVEGAGILNGGLSSGTADTETGTCLGDHRSNHVVAGRGCHA